MMGHVARSLPPTWEDWIEFLSPSLSLAQAWLLGDLVSEPMDGRLSLLVLLSVCLSNNLINKNTASITVAKVI